jgi:glycosyltransferase involved in cell wall biosynthesis
MKLIVQIPCYDEQQTLPQTVADIPRKIAGVDQVEVLIVDDGSTDRTVEIARTCGVNYIVRHKNNRGLARTFRSGLDTCLRLGADIIVNTDGDNQYAGADIPRLIQPILDGVADIVIGDRQTDGIAHFSWTKKRLQNLGSSVVRRLSNTDVPDAVSGFRALSRDAAMKINIVSSFSYTIEMVIQAGQKRLALASVPVRTNPKSRGSRLFKSVPRFVAQSIVTMVRMYVMYQPLRVFFYIGSTALIVGLVPILRFLWFYLQGQGQGQIQSLLLGSTLVVIGVLAYLVGLVADLINHNRQLIEIMLEQARRVEPAMGEDVSIEAVDEPPGPTSGSTTSKAS